MKRHIVLVGLPGSGKTTVGQMVAEELHTALVDVDAVLERKHGKPIAMLFAEFGEGAFREMERSQVNSALDGPPSVVAPGGGWAAQEGNLDRALGRAYVVYLKTSATVAARRAAPENTRPSLVGQDPVARMGELLTAREQFYLRAHGEIITDRLRPEEVATEMLQLARAEAGW